MALNRLRSLIMPLIYDHLDPDSEIRRTASKPSVNPREIDFVTSRQSLGFARVYTKQKAMTFFYRGDELTDNAAGILGYSGRVCLDFDVCDVARDDGDHGQYHKSLPNEKNRHTHLLKGEYLHSEISVKNLECIMDMIKERGCVEVEGKEVCLLADKDAREISRQYKEYKAQKGALSALDESAEEIFNYCANKCINAAKGFSYTFCVTLFDKYVLAYLIDAQKIGYEKQELLKNTFRGALLLAFGSASLSILSNAVLRFAMNKALDKCGVNEDLRDLISNAAGSGFASLSNPVALTDSLFELAMMNSANVAGAAAAHAVIAKLPKLKKDPVDKNAFLVAKIIKKTQVKTAEGPRRRFA